MSRISPLTETPAEVRIAYVQHRNLYQSPINTLKATLAHSLPVFKSYMEWYALYHELSRILGSELANQYTTDVAEALGNAVSQHIQQFIPVRTTAGTTALSPEKAKAVLEFGITIAKSNGRINDQDYERIKNLLPEKDIVVVTAFTGLIVAIAVFIHTTEASLTPHEKISTPDAVLFS